MRILFTDHTSVLGGGELCLLDLLGALPADVEAAVACPDGPLRERVRARGLPTARLAGTTASLRLGPGTPAALAELAAGGVAVARLARSHGSDLVVHNSLRAGLMGCVARSVPGAPPAVVHVHDILPPGGASRLISAVLRRRMDGALANSRATAAAFGEMPSLHVTDNPVDLGRFDGVTRPAPGLPEGVPLLGLVAQITPWKGQLEAIRALALVRERVPDAHLVLAGEVKFAAEGSRWDNRAYLAELHAEVARLGLDGAVRFLGARDDVPALLSQLDVLLMPSHEEPFGRIAAEAMAMGTAVVATDRGGPAEFIQDGVTGRLIEPRDAAALAYAATELLADPALRSRMGKAGAAAARDRFALPLYAARTALVFRAVIAAADREGRPRL